MKSKKIAYIAFILTLVVTFNSCKKGANDTMKVVPSDIVEVSTSAESLSENLSLSEYNFLVFNTMDAFLDYRTFVIEKTHAEIQAYLDERGFVVLGDSLYGENFQDQIVTEEQFINYVFNSSKVFQVDGVVFRPIGESNNEVKWSFLLAMVESNLSNSSYENISSGIFDDNLMNKIATNPEDDSEFDIIEFVKATTGHEDENPNSSQANRPIFGHGNWVNTTCTSLNQDNWIDQNGDGIADPTFWQCRKRSKYFFFINVGSQEDCGFAYSCN